MTGPAPENNNNTASATGGDPGADLDRLAAERHADLVELLGHLNQCWDDERRQLARKLHDNLGSSLTALTMHLALLTQRLPAEKALQDRVAQMKQLLTQIVNTNRQMQLNLWNDKLEFLGVKAAIAELVSEFGQQHAGVKAGVSLPDDDVQCTREQGVALLRVVEEGLRNIEQHAQAGEVEVIVDDNEDELMVTVRDNGVGRARVPAPTTDEKTPHCHGLRMLRERVRYLGGTLDVRDHPDGGTALTAILPKQPAAPAAA